MWWILPAAATTHNIPGDFLTLEAAITSGLVLNGDQLQFGPGDHVGFDFSAWPNLVEVDLLGDTSTTTTLIPTAGSAQVLNLQDNLITIQNLTIDGGYLAAGINAVGSSVLQLSQVQIIHGVASPGTSSGESYGGGIRLDGTSSASLLNSSISSCASIYGGGIAVLSTASLLLQDSTLTGNQATNHGGGIFASATASTTLISTSITSNTASRGGGLYTSFNASIENTRFSGNQAMNDGGAIFAPGGLGTISITDGVFDLNVAGIRGGALSGKATWAITTTHFDTNSAPAGGAINSNTNAIHTLTNVSFCFNSAPSASAVFVRANSSVTVSNAVFLHNTDGPVFEGPGSLHLSNGTFHGNSGLGIDATGRV